MKTKLVYVLTCAPEATYIEQALISIWSARYHNPDAHIVLLVDDLTNQLLIDKRAEVLEYITEKVVVELPAEMNVVNRSRWIKTSVRMLVEGDYLFIDTDTIIARSLADIEQCPHTAAAVLDSHMTVEEYPEALKSWLKTRFAKVDIDLKNVKHYVSSGVILVKTNDLAIGLYARWHQGWRDGLSNGFIGDQPYLLKSDMELGGVIGLLDGRWNCVMYTYPEFDVEAYVLHFSAHENMCFLFDEKCLQVIREQGLEAFKPMILAPQKTYIAHIPSRLCSSYRNIQEALRFIHTYCLDSLPTYLIKFAEKDKVQRMMNGGRYRMAAGYVCGKVLWRYWDKKLRTFVKRLIGYKKK